MLGWTRRAAASASRRTRRADCERLAAEARDELRVLGEVLGEDLHRDVALQAAIARDPDRRHAADAEAVAELVAAREELAHGAVTPPVVSGGVVSVVVGGGVVSVVVGVVSVVVGVVSVVVGAVSVVVGVVSVVVATQSTGTRADSFWRPTRRRRRMRASTDDGRLSMPCCTAASFCWAASQACASIAWRRSARSLEIRSALLAGMSLSLEPPPQATSTAVSTPST